MSVRARLQSCRRTRLYSRALAAAPFVSAPLPANLSHLCSRCPQPLREARSVRARLQSCRNRRIQSRGLQPLRPSFPRPCPQISRTFVRDVPRLFGRDTKRQGTTSVVPQPPDTITWASAPAPFVTAPLPQFSRTFTRDVPRLFGRHEASGHDFSRAATAGYNHVGFSRCALRFRAPAAILSHLYSRCPQALRETRSVRARLQPCRHSHPHSRALAPAPFVTAALPAIPSHLCSRCPRLVEGARTVNASLKFVSRRNFRGQHEASGHDFSRAATAIPTPGL